MAAYSDFRAKLEQRIRALGVSPEGEAWLEKALYPPGDQTSVSIPDSTWVPRMRIDSRPLTTISAHTTLPSGAAWDCLILAPPGDVTAAVIMTAPAGTNWSSTTAPANRSVRILSNLPSSLGSGVIKTYECGVRVAAGTSTANQRTSVSSPMRVQKFRSTYRGITLHNTSSSLYNGGTLLAAQFAPGDCDEHLGFATRDAVLRFFVEKVFDVPLTDDAITQMCPGAVATEARNGTFLPLRLLGPVQPFVREAPSIGQILYTDNLQAETTVAVSNAGTLASAKSFPVGFSSWSGAGTFYPWWVGELAAISGKIDDTGFDNTAFGIISLRGVPYEASFSLQCYVGLEAVLDTESPFRSIMMSPPQYDPRAVQAYYDIVTSMPFAYPASYNAFGLLLPALASAVKAIAPTVMPVIKSVASAVLPGVGAQLADMAGKAIGGTKAGPIAQAGASHFMSGLASRAPDRASYVPAREIVVAQAAPQVVTRVIRSRGKSRVKTQVVVQKRRQRRRPRRN